MKKKDEVKKYTGKRRGRKPKKSTENKPKPPPKKRGRKPKKKTETKEPKVPKKRGRKPQNKSYGFNKTKVNVNPITDDSIIIHLPIKDIYGDINSVDDILNYSPTISEPEPINDDDHLSFIDNVSSKKKNTDKDETKVVNYPKFQNTKHVDNWFNETSIDNIQNEREKELNDIKTEIKKNSVTKSLIQFDEGNKLNYWPKKTKISCWWCTYQFDSTPCALPVYYSDDTYNVKGVFCSPECAAAYNFNTSGITNIWEKYSLLNLLYGKMYDKYISIAPPRNTLKKFGGNLTITQFRQHNVNNDIHFKIISPPLKSIIPCIECSTNTSFSSGKSINNITNAYKLKRSKPYNKNTLEECMRIIKT
uniref:MYM-type domain-containing protein n=1 Tax=viral metagenome TaxID=1070528 RepID=A0A6C0B3Z6_9ZZZZ